MSNDQSTRMTAKAAIAAIRRVILYARVSTDEQAGNYSLPTQLEACRKYAEQNGMVVVAEFSDDYSGATPIEARPEGRKAFAMLKSGEADCLIAYAMDRIARPPEDGDEWDTPLLIRGLARLGKELHTVNRGQLKTDFASLLVAMLDAKGAGEERRKIIERTSRGRNAKARDGRYVGAGPAPYGFHKGDDGDLAVDEGEAAIVRDIYQWYAVDLLTGHEVAKRLSESRVTTPGESRGYRRKRESGVWEKATVYAILENEVYCGVWRYGKVAYKDNRRVGRRDEGDMIPISVTSIIARPLWELAQKRRKDGKNTSRRNLEFLLTGRIRCGCDNAMTGCANGRGTLYYGCGSVYHRIVKTEHDCKERHVRLDVIESLAWEHALQSKKSVAEFLAMLKEYQEQQKRDTAPLAGQIAEVKAMLETASRRIKRLSKLRGEATDDDEVGQYLADLDVAKADKASQERKLAKLEAEYNWTDTLTDDDILAVLDMRSRDLEKLQGATFEEKRRYLAKIDLRVIVKNREATIECKLPVPQKIVNLDSGVVVSCAS